MLYIAYFIIVGNHNIKKKLNNFPFLRCRGWIEPPTNSYFEAFGGDMAWARWAQWPLHGSPWALKSPYCHRMMTQTHPRGNRRVSEKVKM